MRYFSRIYDNDGDLQDPDGRRCYVIDSDDPRVDLGLKTFTPKRGIILRVGSPWVKAESDIAYIVKTSLVPALPR